MREITGAGMLEGTDTRIQLSEIASDTLRGLSAKPKYLLSKYFYDNTGSMIFQEIMKMPEYYLTNCEFEIFAIHKDSIADAFKMGNKAFIIIDLGSGDGIKTKILLRALHNKNAKFKYVPVDISKVTNEELYESLKMEMPVINVEPETGDYFSVLGSMNNNESDGKVILFLGSNIGNLNDMEINAFLEKISAFTHRGDKFLIGFDLKKSPDVIMKAYHDPHGLTREFNLNHLVRLNRELQADFNLQNFEHHTEYNPVNGMLKSFLVSTEEQEVSLRALDERFHFEKWEPVFMELSRKFDNRIIEELASSHGFRVDLNFTDQRNYFVDSLWTRI
jgi:dimethylhistidine N-methyltransferase